jgi:hypothetical protein
MVPEEVITKDDYLYRRVISFSVNPDKTVNSSAFRLRKSKRADPEISVDLARMITAQECLQIASIVGLGVAELCAEIPIGMGLIVKHDPQPEDPAHSLIIGATSLAQCRMLADNCTLVIPPPPSSFQVDAVEGV